MNCYTYLIGWTAHNKFYYGARANKNSNGQDLWVTYFTSSKTVKRFRLKYGEPDVVEYRQRFQTKEEAFNWEAKVLRRMRVVKDKRFLNNTDKTMKFLTQYWQNVSDEEREMIHATKRGQGSPRALKISKAKKGKSNDYIKGSNHPQAVRVTVNGIEFGCYRDAADWFDFPNADQVKHFISGKSRGLIVEDKYFNSPKAVCDTYLISRSILNSYVAGEIDKLEYPHCCHCNVTSKSLYLHRRWHKDCSG